MKKFLATLIALFAILQALPGQTKEKLSRYNIIPKKEKLAGLQFAFVNLGSENSEYMLIANNLDARAHFSNIAPMFAYAYAPDHVIGVKASFTSLTGQLDATSLSLLNDGLEFDLSDVSASEKVRSIALFHRTYIGLEEKGRVGLFYDFTLSYGVSQAAFAVGDPSDDSSSASRVKLAFSPGIVFFPSANISTHVGISIADVSYNRTSFITDGVESGTKTTFKAQARLDLMGLYFGLVFHL